MADFTIDNLKIYEEKTSTTSNAFRAPKVYLNPTSNLINIEMVEDDVTYHLYNSTGSLLSKSNKTSELDLSNYPNGVYFLRFNDDKAPYSIRIIKQ